jgi:superfamily II DNA or RNA helicase
MTSVVVTKKNETHVRVAAEPSILAELSDLFTFEVPDAKFSPKYKEGHWDGKIKLFHAFSGELPLGLISKVYDYCKENGYEFVNNCDIIRDDVSEEAWSEFIDSMTFCCNGEPIAVREYQVDSTRKALQRGRAILLSPTGSGKSLMLYVLLRWHQQHDRKQLIIVPNQSLVEQLYKDFEDYATNDTWSAEETCVKIYSGQERDFSKNVTIATWQTLITLPKTFFHQFDVVYDDECHLAKAKSITEIMNNCINAGFRVGTTGTMDGTKINELVLEGLFGPVIHVTTTKKLMDADQLADLTIKGIVLQYSDEERKFVANRMKQYKEEAAYLVAHASRNQFICNLALSTKGNTLLLFQFVEKHGKVLYELIQAKGEADRKVFFVHGGVNVDEREDIRRIAESETDAIIVASVGVFSTGVNLPNLRNIIFAAPTKSRIRNLQSIGRGLRRTSEKTACTLYDIGDDLSWKSRQNYALLHFIERITLYAKEGFEYVLTPVELL